MPIECEVIEAAKVVVSTVRGSLELADIVDYFERIWTTGRYAGFSELFDLRAVTTSELSLAAVRNVAGAAQTLIAADDSARLALVSRQGEAVKLANAYKMFRELRSGPRAQIRVFEDVEEARRWLGIPADG